MVGFMALELGVRGQGRRIHRQHLLAIDADRAALLVLHPFLRGVPLAF